MAEAWHAPVAMLDGGGFLSSVERYDPATNAWEAVAPMVVERFAHAMAALDGKLYAVGGQNDDEEEDGDIGILGRCGPSTPAPCDVLRRSRIRRLRPRRRNRCHLNPREAGLSPRPAYASDKARIRPLSDLLAPPLTGLSEPTARSAKAPCGAEV